MNDPLSPDGMRSDPKTPPGTSATGGLGAGPGTGGLRGGLEITDLSNDGLIAKAVRVEYQGKQVPSVGGIFLLAKLGQGGMGAVYYGFHSRLEEPVAIKVLPYHLAETDPDLIKRFYREARIAAKVKSPHLVGVSDVNEELGLYYLVMEFVSGKSAGAYLKEVRKTGDGIKGLPEKAALKICIAATQGLVAAHEYGVIHRDIKPDNIMVPKHSRGDGLDFIHTKLADLGLARSEDRGHSLTLTNFCLGTPGYMSPEQAMDAKHVNKRADVFSMGATLYALLAGVSPFANSSLMQILTATCETPHVPIRQHRPDVSELTSKVLDKCLEKDAGKRYADANELLRALEECDVEKKPEQRFEAAATIEVVLNTRDAPISKCTLGASEALVTDNEVVDDTGDALENENVLTDWSTSPRPALLRPPPSPPSRPVKPLVPTNGSNDSAPSRPKNSLVSPRPAQGNEKTAEREFPISAKHWSFLRIATIAAAAVILMGFGIDLVLTKSGKDKKTENVLTAERERSAKTRLPVWGPLNLSQAAQDAGARKAEADLMQKKTVDAARTADEEHKAKLAFIEAEEQLKTAEFARELEARNAVAELKLKAEAARIADEKRKIQDTQTRYDTAMNAASDKLIAEDFAGAEQAYKAALTEKPDDPSARKGLEDIKSAQAGVQYRAAMTEGRRKRAQNDFGGADESFQAAMKVNGYENDSTAKNAREECKTARAENEIILDLGGGVKMELVRVKAGAFRMGSDEDDKDARIDEKPARMVRISKDYFIGKYPVTVAQFKHFVADSGYQTEAEQAVGVFVLVNNKWEISDTASWKSPGFEQSDEHPVVEVSWNDAQAYCKWLSKKSGDQVSLPTEAQWEFAARGPENRKYPWGNAFDSKKCNHADLTLKESGKAPDDLLCSDTRDGFVFTAPVGLFDNESWCHAKDLAGNVRQWCQDKYNENYYVQRPANDMDPQWPATGDEVTSPFDNQKDEMRVLRGGSWYDAPLRCRSTSRDRRQPDLRFNFNGFRVVVLQAPALFVQMNAAKNGVLNREAISEAEENLAVGNWDEAVQAYKRAQGYIPDSKEASAGLIKAAELIYKAAQKENDGAKKSTLYLKSGELGNAAAQMELGWLYWDGPTQDKTNAIKWWHMAAENDNAEAQLLLTAMYAGSNFIGIWSDNDAGTPGLSWTLVPEIVVETAERNKWLERLVKNVEPRIQCSLGLLYIENGLGLTQNKADRIRYLLNAGEKGNSFAQFLLGCLYDGDTWNYLVQELKHFVIIDRTEAVKWYRKAAEQNIQPAEHRLADMYFNGEGVPRDFEEALKLYKKDAEQGCPLSQSTLGNIYGQGLVVKKDENEASKWNRMAGATGNESARKSLLAGFRADEIDEGKFKKMETDDPSQYNRYQKLIAQGKSKLQKASAQPAPAPALAIPAPTLTLDLDGNMKMELVLIPAGKFMMGSPETELERFENETQHEVTITTPFYMGKYATTQEQYEAIMGVNPSKFKGAKRPVEQVSWEDAHVFCKKLSAKVGKQIRLPTEAEWEYGCRGGTTTPFYFGNTITTEQVNYNGNNIYGSGTKGKYREETTDVGTFPSNQFGLFDMHGNVFQWCEDFYGEYPNEEVIDPKGPTDGAPRVVRGGSWFNVPNLCRSANRNNCSPVCRNTFFGFRVVVVTPSSRNP